jgi:SOS response associated peptidase (SRAP)
VERTFAVITVPSNDLVGQIHDRMPAILEPKSYDRWLGLEPDPFDLLITYPLEPMTMWPISTRVNKPENDDPSISDRAAEPVDWQAPLDASLETNTDVGRAMTAEGELNDRKHVGDRRNDTAEQAGHCYGSNEVAWTTVLN